MTDKLERAIADKTFKTIDKINDNNHIKNLSYFSKQINDCVLYIFLIKAFETKKYNNKNEDKIIDELIIELNFDIERVDEVIENGLYTLNYLTRKNILIKTKQKNINYYKLNKDYIKEICRKSRNKNDN